MKVKKWDVIIIGLFVVASFIPALIFTLNARIETDLGINIVEFIDEKVGMYEADCPDKICYSPEYILRPGETIVCLPNRVVIEVKGESPDENDADIITGWKSDNHE